MKDLNMKKILSYTIGWDIKSKQGYMTAIDEDDTSHAFADISQDELRMLVDMLKEHKVYIDNSKWIIGGWNQNTPMP